MSTIIRALPDGPSAFDGRGHIITSADELLEAWAARDELYVQRATPLTKAEVLLIRAQRVFEAGFIEPRRRGPVYVKARHWRPPALKDWS